MLRLCATYNMPVTLAASKALGPDQGFGASGARVLNPEFTCVASEASRERVAPETGACGRAEPLPLGRYWFQDPNDAEFGEMPRSAPNHRGADHCVPLAEIPAVLRQLVQQQAPMPSVGVSDELQKEIDIAQLDPQTMADDDKPGTPSAFTCPECNGALWAALRSLEETASLARRMSAKARPRNHLLIANRFEGRAEETEQHAESIRQMILEGGMLEPTRAAADEEG